MEFKKIEEINEYKSKSVNPQKNPNVWYELYSIPSFDSKLPEIVRGKDIASSKQIVEEGDILISKINPRINRVWIVNNHSKHLKIASSEWIVVRTKKYNNKYLSYYFKSDRFKQLLSSQVTGIGGSLTRAQPKNVKNYKVLLLSVNKQSKVVELLDEIGKVIDKRLLQIKALEQLTQNVFLEMYGDIRRNKKGWDIVSLEDICENIIDCPHSTPKYSQETTEYACIRTSELSNGYIKWGSMKYVDESEFEKRIKRLNPEIGDIVYGREGTFGEAVILTDEKRFCLGQRVMLFRPDYKVVNSIFLWAMVRSKGVYHQALSKTSGSTVGHVNVKDVKKFKCFLPPLDSQNEFAQKVKKIEIQKKILHKSYDETIDMYNSIMQRAFKGELFTEEKPSILK
jgi:type I restriction enzyme, S subunit